MDKVSRQESMEMSARDLTVESACNAPSTIKVKNIAAPSSVRKKLGAFYTPESLSRVLTDWAIRSQSDTILEPSFGGCGFLEAARRRLNELGCESPKKQIFGCDIDDKAFNFLADVLGQPVDMDQFLLKDFLQLRAGREWPFLFSATVGNPPYIPYQAIPEANRKEYFERWGSIGAGIGKRASLWAHFLAHAVSFVAPGGRMAWVLPGAFLQADYAVEVRQFLAKSFGDVLCVLMRQRFFKEVGTEEETVLLLARDRHESTNLCDIQFVDASSVSEFSRIVELWESGERVGRTLNARPSYLAVSDNVITAFENVRARSDCHLLGAYLKTSIGLVTGANSFFVLNGSSLLAHDIPIDSATPILAKMLAAPGLSFSGCEHAAYVAAGGNGYLIHSKTFPDKGTPLQLYLDSFPEKQRNEISTFKKRSIWHAPDDGKIPDAFFSVMNHDGPRLVLNEAQINCTNTIYRAFFHQQLDSRTKKLLALSVFTSFSQLSAEFVGRRYGSGVLKHEPRDAEKIAVILPNNVTEQDVDAAFLRVDVLLRNGKIEDAYDSADSFVLHKLLGGKALSTTFKAALFEVRKLRRDARQHVSA